MRHVFYPAIQDFVGEQRRLRIPDLDVTMNVSPDADVYTTAVYAAAAAIDALRREDRPPPLPSPVGEFSDAAPPRTLFAVPVATHRDYIRIGINMDTALLYRVDEAASLRGMSRTAFLSLAATSMIDGETAAA